MIDSDPLSDLGRMFHRLITTRAPHMIWLRRALLVLICAIGLLRLGLFVQSLYPPYVYRKDFIQEYLLAKAALTGVNPYLPLSELAEKFLGPISVPLLPHPTPHPPPVIFLGLVFGLLPYPWATLAWGIFTLLCVGVSIWLILGLFNKKRVTLLSVVIMILVWVGWRPFLEELIYGQFMILLALLLNSSCYLETNRKSIDSTYS